MCTVWYILLDRCTVITLNRCGGQSSHEHVQQTFLPNIINFGVHFAKLLSKWKRCNFYWLAVCMTNADVIVVSRSGTQWSVVWLHPMWSCCIELCHLLVHRSLCRSLTSWSPGLTWTHRICPEQSASVCCCTGVWNMWILICSGDVLIFLIITVCRSAAYHLLWWWLRILPGWKWSRPWWIDVHPEQLMWRLWSWSGSGVFFRQRDIFWHSSTDTPLNDCVLITLSLVISTECALIGCSLGVLSRFMAHDPVHGGYDLLRCTQLIWNVVRWHEMNNIMNTHTLSSADTGTPAARQSEHASYFTPRLTLLSPLACCMCWHNQSPHSRGRVRWGEGFGKKFPHTDTPTRYPDWLSRASQHARGTTKNCSYPLCLCIYIYIYTYKPKTALDQKLQKS